MSVWRLNNEKLLVADVQTFPVPPARASRQRRLTRRQVQNDGREGGEKLEDRGWNLPQGTFIFHLLGRGTPKVDELEYIVNQIEDNEIITLEAPDTLPAHIFLDQKRAPLSIESYQPDQSEATGLLKLQLRFSVLGKWIADGGNYDQEIHGRFKQTDGTPTYEREDGTTQSDLTVTVDEQETGYLKAKNPSTLAWDTLSPSSTSTRTNRDGEDIPTETYDLTGYLFPSDPSTTGDVGLFEIRQAPTFGFISAASATITSASSVTAVGILPTDMAAVLTNASSVAGAMVLIQAATSTITGASTVSAAAVVIEATPISAVITNASDVSAAGLLIHAASATIQSASAVAAVGDVQPVKASATIQSASTVTGSPAITIRTISATILAISDMDADSEIVRDISAALTNASTVSAAADVRSIASSTLSNTASLNPGNPQIAVDATIDAFESGDLAEYQGDT